MKHKRILAGGIAGLAAALALPAAAQSIDYGSLEQMFNEPVTTSATGSPQRASQAPVDMDIITAADIKRSGATDLPTILSRVAGVDLMAESAQGADVGVRGYDTGYNPRLLVLVNGRQVYLDYFGYTAWSTIGVRLEEIRQIEVVKGPNAALFGFNAVSGVINIITYNPKYDDKSFATGRVGSNGYKEASLGQTFKLGDRFAARLTGGVSRQHEFEDTVGAASNPLYPTVERLTANLDTVTKLTEKLDLRIEGSWSHDRQNELAATDAYLSTKYLVTGAKGTLNWDSPIGAARVLAYQNRSSTKFYGAADAINNKVSVLNVQDLFKIGAKHTFRVSAEYRKTDMGLSDNGAFGYEVKALAGMWNWQALDNLSFTAAARYDDLRMARTGPFPAGVPGTNDFFARRISTPSYNAGVSWSPSDSDTFRATYARGSQMPSLLDLAYQATIAPGAFLIGDSLLQPTVVTNYGLSYDRALPQIQGSASVRLFYQKSRNIKGQPTFTAPDAILPGAFIFTYLNVSDSDMRGIEAVAKGAYANGVRWSANYTYTDVNDDPNGVADLFQRKAAFALTTPKHRANVNVGFDHGPWTVDGFVRFQSKSTGYSPVLIGFATPVEVGAYASLAGRVAYNFDHGITLALSGQNLGENRQRQTAGLLVERRIFATLSKTW